MVDQWTGKWYPEEDYDKYPKEKWCDLDSVCVEIRKDGYVPETDIENLIWMCIGHYDNLLEFDDEFVKEIDDDDTISYGEKIKEMVETEGGWKEFDYYC